MPMHTRPYKGKSAIKITALLVLVLLFVAVPIALSHLPSNANLTPPLSAGEDRATHAFGIAKGLGEPGLYGYLRRMPKGADLHMHLSGAIYAETFLQDAVADKLCVDPKALSLVKVANAAAGNAQPSACAKDDVTAASVFANQKLEDAMIDSFSMRSFVPTPGRSGHDQFFATFDRFGGPNQSHEGEWLDEVATRASAQNEQYLEVMMTPSFFDLAPLWNKLGWPGGTGGAVGRADAAGTSAAELAGLRAKLLEGGLRDEAALDRTELDDALATRDRREHCGQPDGTPACLVKIRVIYQVLRAFPPQQVFAQTLLAFEVASSDPNVVGLNFVQPEDAYMAMSEYDRQMHMLDYLHSIYPQVHISLHAGELAPGLVPPDGLNFHIREAVELGHAERIGHGVDVLHEADPRALLRELARRHVMVEINLTSNDVILGIKGDDHPLAAYMAARVPVALSTDDEGVSRIDITHEYVRAVEEQGLGYADLKRMARTSLEHSFLPGQSLWSGPDIFTRVKDVCVGQHPGPGIPGGDCGKLLQSSEKAAQQWELERRFATFEASPPLISGTPSH